MSEETNMFDTIEEIDTEDVSIELESVEEQQEVNNTKIEKPNQEVEKQEMVSVEDSSEELIEEDFEPEIQKKSRQQIEEEFGVRKNMDGKVLTIVDYEILKPKTKKKVEGTIVSVPPEDNSDEKTGKEATAWWYSSKLKISFNDNLVDYYPSITYFCNKDGEIQRNKEGKVTVSLYRDGNKVVSQMTRLCLYYMSDKAFKLEYKKINGRTTLVVTKDTEAEYKKFSKTVSDISILEWMKGKKVLIKTDEGNYKGKDYFRNDFSKFVL